MSASETPINDVLRRAADQVRAATAERDAAIVAAVAAGVSMREVARTAQMSATAVRHIVNRDA